MRSLKSLVCMNADQLEGTDTEKVYDTENKKNVP